MRAFNRDAMTICGRGAGNPRRLGQGHNRVTTAIFTLLEIVLVGVVIASLIAIATVTQIASSFSTTRFNTSRNPHVSGMI